MKKIISLFITLILVFSSVLSTRAIEESTPKEEVVYGVLNTDGSVKTINVINSLVGGDIVDYGEYTQVSNMTTTDVLRQNDDLITTKTNEDRLYYQGTLQSKELPWNVSVVYTLDGKQLKASELLGKSGNLTIELSITKNQIVNPIFYNNYMLQVSLTVDTQKFSNIISDGATIANAGKNKIITNTVLPGKDGHFVITADVKDLTMNGIEIAGIPFSMMFDLPSTDSLTNQLIPLSEAVHSLYLGTKGLSDGLKETNNGTLKIAKGSSEFAVGLSTLSSNSKDLVDSSIEIRDALNKISSELSDSEQPDLTSISLLPSGLRQLGNGLNELNTGLSKLKTSYSQAYTALDTAIAGIPTTTLTQEDLTNLYLAASVDPKLLETYNQLVSYYTAAKTVQGTYSQVQLAFTSVIDALTTTTDQLTELSSNLYTTADDIETALSTVDFTSLQDLIDGIGDLASNYTLFHNGLSDYTSGVETLSSSYTKINDGVQSLSGGIGELSNGGKQLSGGMNSLNNGVQDLPKTIQEEIDQLMKNYDTSDFTPVSFVSSKNTHVTSVQFVLKTDSIEKPMEVKVIEDQTNKLSFWEKLLKLLGF